MSEPELNSEREDHFAPKTYAVRIQYDFTTHLVRKKLASQPAPSIVESDAISYGVFISILSIVYAALHKIEKGGRFTEVIDRTEQNAYCFNLICFKAHE